MSLKVNLAALTEGELLALYGPQQTQARMPEISRARLDGRPLLGRELPGRLPTEPVAEASGRIWGATPEQSRELAARHQALLAGGAVPQGTYELLPPYWLVRGYVLGDTVLSLHWDEGAYGSPSSTLSLLTWLRDRASGLSCVMTSDARTAPAPTPSEEIDTHQHPGLGVTELLARHRGHVQRLGKPMKLAAERPWFTAWQAAYDLNLAAWKRRGVIVEP